MDEHCQSTTTDWFPSAQYPMTLDNHGGRPRELPQPRRGSSQTIPLPSYHIPKTESELQLCEDMEMAEWRDLRMFYLVVNGIRERQRKIDGVNVTPYESSPEESPPQEWSDHSGWSMGGFSEPSSLPQLPRRFLPSFPSSLTTPAVTEPTTKSNPDMPTLEEDYVFSLDL